MSKVAVIVETRKHRALPFVLNNMNVKNNYSIFYYTFVRILSAMPDM